MKVGNLDIPDHRLLLIGCPKITAEELEKFTSILRKALLDGNDILTSNYRFSKVAETDKTVIVNLESK